MRLAIGLRPKFLLLLLGASTLPLMAVGVALGVYIYRFHYGEAENLVAKGGQVLVRELDTLGRGLLDQANALAARPEVVASINLVSTYQDPRNYQPLIFDLEKERLAGDLENEVLTHHSNDGRAFAVYGEDRSLAAFALESDSALSKGVVSYENGRPLILVAKGVKADTFEPGARPSLLPGDPGPAGRVRYVARNGQLALEAVAPIFRALPDGGGRTVGYVTLTRELGSDFATRLALATDLQVAIALGNKRLAGRLPLPESTPGNGGKTLVSAGGYLLRAYPLPLEGGGAAVLYGVEERMMLASFRGALGVVLAVLLSSALLAVVAGIILSRRALRPIRSLSAGAEAVGRGDPGVRVEVETGDELQRLADTFNRMAATIRQREKELRAAADRLRLHREQTLLAYVEWDRDFRVVEWNPAAEQIFGYRREEALGRSGLDLVVPEAVRPRVGEIWQQLMHQESGSFSVNENVTKDGRTVVCEWNNTALVDEQGEVIGVASLARDITQRIQAEESIRRLNATLQERVREEVEKNREKELLLVQQSRLAAMGEMVHNIAHQWRQPLNALNIVVANIQDDFEYGELTKDSLRQSVKTAHKLVQGMSTTIDDFRNFFRPDQVAVRFDIAGAVTSAADIMEAALRNNIIRLDLELEEGLAMEGFPSQFSQAVLNLLANAKEAIQAREVQDGRITARLRREGNQAVLEVEDNGGGIAPEVLPKVFDPYFTTKAQGSGIGLYMTKTIIEKYMGGKVEAGNADGGARFTLRVPLAAGKV